MRGASRPAGASRRVCKTLHGQRLIHLRINYRIRSEWLTVKALRNELLDSRVNRLLLNPRADLDALQSRAAEVLRVPTPSGKALAKL
jgi:hypothetical protein